LAVPPALASNRTSDRADIVVAQDGSGHFTSIQSAMNSIPKDNAKNVIILIKNGIYNEKLFITTSYLTFVGEIWKFTTASGSAMKHTDRQKL
ncbi:MAG TPA: pectinesterase family protein, partial [Bacteroidota bacterium]